MAMTAAHYLTQLQALLPDGAAWPRDPAAVMTRLLRAMAEEFARLDARCGALVDEADPRTTYELLSEWESAFGLPNPCTGALATVQERQAALAVKVTKLGGQSQAFYIGVAAKLGYTITITEFPIAMASTLSAGDALGVVGSEHVWRVNAPAVTIRTFRVGRSVVGERLRSWGNELLECAITRLKPAHTNVLFGYGG